VRCPDFTIAASSNVTTDFNQIRHTASFNPRNNNLVAVVAAAVVAVAAAAAAVVVVMVIKIEKNILTQYPKRS
jgi:hypothetical protein